MRRAWPFVIAFAMLSTACVKRTVLPDPTIPHQVARDAVVEVWCNDGSKLVRCRVRLAEGWWVASPQVVE